MFWQGETPRTDRFLERSSKVVDPGPTASAGRSTLVRHVSRSYRQADSGSRALCARRWPPMCTGIATRSEAEHDAVDDMSVQALAVDIASKFLIRRSRTELSDGSWEIHTEDRNAEYIGLLLETRRDIMQKFSIAASHDALPGAAVAECHKLLKERAKHLYEGKGRNPDAKPRQAYRAWLHTTYGGNWPVDCIFLFGGITEDFVWHLNNEVRERVVSIIDNRIRRGWPLNTGKAAISKVNHV